MGHNPSAQIICASYAQDLADKHARDCRGLLSSDFYRSIFPTRLSPDRKAVHEFMTTEKGVRLATSVGGVLTGRGADFIIIDDPLKPDEALSETVRNAANAWYDHTLYSRLNDKKTGCIILIMQRLHEDDLVGHVLSQNGSWKVLRFPAIAEEDESYVVDTVLGRRCFKRRVGEALHPERESLEILKDTREIQGEYNFAGQYQQAPAPFGGGIVKAGWFKTYNPNELPPKFEAVLQSWDTANKTTELSDYSVCTTWGVKENHIYLLHVLRRRMDYPALKRAVVEQAQAYHPNEIIIEDKASGTQLIQELVYDGVHGVRRYEPPKMEKAVRLHTVSGSIENGFVHLPEKAEWLAEYLHELTTFPNGKYDDQADSTSQALDWIRRGYWGPGMGIFNYYKSEYEKLVREGKVTPPAERPKSPGAPPIFTRPR
jgi:predicted phage terminase large subunit-like protein